MRIMLFRKVYSKTSAIINNNDNGSAVQPTSEGDPRFGEGPGFGELSSTDRPLGGNVQPPLFPAPAPLQW